MSTQKATWINGQVVLAGNANWPEGCQLLVQDASLPPIDFITEEQQSNYPAAVQNWVDDLNNIPPLSESWFAEQEPRDWDETMRQHNIEAVRRQFQAS